MVWYGTRTVLRGNTKVRSSKVRYFKVNLSKVVIRIKVKHGP